MIIQPSVVNKISGSSTGWWQRPADWLPIDNLVSAGDDKFVGLYAISPNDSLDAPGNTLKVLCNFAWTINWGDGTTNNISAGVEASHTYDFDTIDADTETSEGFRQVIVTVTATSGNMDNYVHFGRLSSATTLCNWLDILISSQYITALYCPTPYYNTLRLNKFVWLGTTYNGLTLYFPRNSQLKVFSIDWSLLSSLQLLFYYGSSFDDMGDITSNASVIGYFMGGSYARKIGNITLQSATTGAYAFNGCLVDEIGNIDLRSSTSAGGIFQNSTIKKVGTINISAATSLYFGFNCPQLMTPLMLTTSSALTECGYAFYSCSNLPEISISDASGITGTTGMFASCTRLAALRLPGMPTTFSVASCNMGAAALDTLFGDLADLTGLTAQTITITGNPGAATCDQTIATAKNWTVVS